MKYFKQIFLASKCHPEDKFGFVIRLELATQKSDDTGGKQYRAYVEAEGQKRKHFALNPLRFVSQSTAGLELCPGRCVHSKMRQDEFLCKSVRQTFSQPVDTI